MQKTSKLYDSIFNNADHYTETMVKIAGVDYFENSIVSIGTTASIFSGDNPEVGCCVARKIKMTILKPSQIIPPAAKVEPFMRLTDGRRFSEWLPKGKFYIDTREEEDVNAASDGLTINGFCDMLRRGEADCPTDGLNWPATDIDVVRRIAQDMGVELDPRTVAALNLGYTIQLPAGYSNREVLSAVAAMYGGSFIMSDEGKLFFISMNDIPERTHYLIRNDGAAITFGGVRILV